MGKEGRGDLYVVIKVVTPVALDERQRELLSEFHKLEAKKGDFSAR